MAVALKPEKISVAELEMRMRHLPVPIIPRTANDTVLIDVRTVDRSQFRKITDQLVEYGIMEEDSKVEVR